MADPVDINAILARADKVLKLRVGGYHVGAEELGASLAREDVPALCGELAVLRKQLSMTTRALRSCIQGTTVYDSGDDSECEVYSCMSCDEVVSDPEAGCQSMDCPIGEALAKVRP
jgi:hypothetical protein